ncbi:MAG: DUF167 domain-containing protein [Verrucomicrobiales bacterium]
MKPGSRESTLTEQSEGSYVARLKSPPVDGKANEELIRLIANHFGVARAEVVIKTGLSARLKRVQIPGAD